MSEPGWGVRVVEQRSLDIYIAKRPEDRKRTLLKTITLGPQESPPATVEHDGTTYSWRFVHAVDHWALYCEVVRG